MWGIVQYEQISLGTVAHLYFYETKVVANMEKSKEFSLTCLYACLHYHVMMSLDGQWQLVMHNIRWKLNFCLNKHIKPNEENTMHMLFGTGKSIIHYVVIFS
jgi:hypothetical protein